MKNKNKEVLVSTKGDNLGTIDALIESLTQAKEDGATHYEMQWSNDRVWAFKWFRLFYYKTDGQIKLEKIKEHEEAIRKLKENA